MDLRANFGGLEKLQRSIIGAVISDTYFRQGPAIVTVYGVSSVGYGGRRCGFSVLNAGGVVDVCSRGLGTRLATGLRGGIALLQGNVMVTSQMNVRRVKG